MGFLVNRVVTLEFEGYMQGAEVKLRAASTETMLKLREMSVVESVPLLAEHVVEWNLTYKDAEDVKWPVPCTAEGILRHLERQMIDKIATQWYLIATGASAPLDPPSDDGEPSPDTENMAPSLTMEVL